MNLMIVKSMVVALLYGGELWLIGRILVVFLPIGCLAVRGKWCGVLVIGSYVYHSDMIVANS